MKYEITVTIGLDEPAESYMLTAWEDFFRKGAASIPDAEVVSVEVREAGDE